MQDNQISQEVQAASNNNSKQSKAKQATQHSRGADWRRQTHADAENAGNAEDVEIQKMQKNAAECSRMQQDAARCRGMQENAGKGHSMFVRYRGSVGGGSNPEQRWVA